MTAGPTVRLRLLVAYHGAGFHGFALQPGVRTVGGALAGALERHLRHTVELTCAGRTDAGVHAWGQVVSFDARADVDVVALQRAVNRTLRPTVVVRAAEPAPAGFDARRWATGPAVPVHGAQPPGGRSLQRRDRLARGPPLDLTAMRLACDALYRGARLLVVLPAAAGEPGRLWCGSSDDADWVDMGDGMLRFDIEASSFCQQMVRSIVGTLVDIGRGRRKAGEMAAVVRARSRAAAGQPAPPHGLCLWEVDYRSVRPFVSGDGLDPVAGGGQRRRPPRRGGRSPGSRP